MNISARILSIDLLRAIAAFGVYMFHSSLFAGFDKFSLPISIPYFLVDVNIPNFFSLGASGVSLFFVISGFVLTRSWFKNKNQQLNFSDYYFRRFTRIYPAYLFSVCVTLLIYLLFKNYELSGGVNENKPSLINNFFIHLIFLQGFLPFSFQSFNGTLWSMSTEVQFYLLLPFLYIFWMRKWPLNGVLVIGAMCIILRYYGATDLEMTSPIDGGVSYSVLISYSIAGRLFEFVIGLYIASLEYQNRLRRFGFSKVLFVLLITAAVRWKGPGWLADPFFGIAYGVILVWFLTNIEDLKSVYLKIFIVKKMQLFGIYSYSFFLIHWPVLMLSQQVGWLSGVAGWTHLVLDAPVCFFVSYVLAKWMFVHIEDKFHNNLELFKQKLSS